MIRILTDSASDILPAEAEQLGVTVIPLNVTLEDGTVLRDGIDKTPSEYYALLKECHKLPTTSQPSPELFERFYQDAAAAGDEVLGIFLSHELSGTWQCARLAADLVNVDNVLFVDSANVCLGEGCWYGWLCSCAPPVRRWCRSPPTWSTPRSTCIWLPPSTT